jgi:predicted acyl esterase
VPLTDADDELDWLGTQVWSNGKVGLIGCSSTAEWQLSVASRGDKSLATFIPESFGAGVGRVGPYYEQGNWFRGGAVQMLFATWLYDYGLETATRSRISRRELRSRRSSRRRGNGT